MSSLRAPCFSLAGKGTPLLSRSSPVSPVALMNSCGVIIHPSIPCLPLHPSKQCQVRVERLDRQPSFATSFLYMMKTFPRRLCVHSFSICIPKLGMFPSLAHLTYLSIPVCKPFATAFSFLDSQELSFAPLSFPPPIFLLPCQILE